MAIRTQLKNGKTLYEVYVTGVDSRGRRFQWRRCNIDTKFKAEKLEFELKRQAANQKDSRKTYNWSEWHQICLDQMKPVYSPATLENYDGRLRKWIPADWNDRLLENFTRQHVYELVFENLTAKTSFHSRWTIFKMIRRLFEMAVEEGILDRNPCAGMHVKVPEVDQKVLTNAEVEIFLRAAKITNHRFYPMWAMALMTGMRSGELCALKWTDIDFESRTISVSKQWTSKAGIGPTKTQRSRVVPISDDLQRFLKDLKVKRGNSDNVLEHLPEWQHGEQARITREFCQAIGVTPIKFHDLRATFITNLLARGESLARVMAIVGHSQLKTTNGYLRKAGVDVQGGTDKLGYHLPDESVADNVIAFRRPK